MTKNKNTIFLKNLSDSFYELFKEDEAEAVEFLKEEGIDINEFEKNCENFIKKVIAKNRIRIGRNEKERRLKILNKALEIFQKYKKEDIKKILTPEEQLKLGFQFRNLEKLDDKAKENIFNDDYLIKIMEKLNQND